MSGYKAEMNTFNVFVEQLYQRAQSVQVNKKFIVTISDQRSDR